VVAVGLTVITVAPAVEDATMKGQQSDLSPMHPINGAQIATDTWSSRVYWGVAQYPLRRFPLPVHCATGV
jgi:hypothetical protein